jgi:pimeloyl-ACP methyl ester carboxylesterase
MPTVAAPMPRLIRPMPTVMPPLPPMPPVPAGQYDSTEVRQAVRRDRSERRARFRSRWWFPLLIVGLVVAGFWGALKVDQRVADALVWPSHGARFVEVSSSIDTPSRPGGRLTVVVGGLNRTSGTGVALALLPSLEAGGARVFSMVYGSGINDQDIRDKFDALIAEVKPREISFFGSSMGGDVVLNMAAHAQQNRDQYVQDEVLGGAGTVGTGDLAAPDAGPPTVDGPAAPATDPTDPTDLSGGQPLGSETGSLTEFLLPAALTNTLTGLIGRLPVAAVDAGIPAAGPNTASNGSGSTSAGNGFLADGNADSGSQSLVTLPPPRIGTIYLDCTPLGSDDVRDASRTQADALTGLTEAIGTDGGAVTRLAAEMLGQRHQWASGRFPFLHVRWDDFDYKLDQLMREKIGGPGVSTQLIKDQYGVIRRLDMNTVAGTLAPGARIVYFLPATPTDDRTVRVEQVQTELRTLETSAGLNVQFVHIPGGHHASAESNPDSYRLGIDTTDDIGP